MLQVKSGNCMKPSPGRRSRCTVVMKFSPVMMDEKPRMNTAKVARVTFVWVLVLKGT